MQMSNFRYLGCVDHDVDHNFFKFRSLCRTIMKDNNETNSIKISYRIDLPVFLYGSETWVRMKNPLSRIQPSEMRCCDLLRAAHERIDFTVRTRAKS